MNEQEKLGEAQHFFAELARSQNNSQVFRYNLSALLSAARSVLQYALEEARKKPGGLVWYEKRIAKTAMCKFFKNKRNINIHREPLAFASETGVSIIETLQFSDSVVVVLGDSSGVPISEAKSQLEKLDPAIPLTVMTLERFKFDDWRGPEDIISLCRTYLDELSSFITEGKTQGWITK